MEWESLVTKVADCLAQRESYQRIVGQLAAFVIETRGNKALKEFSANIKENSGLSISPSTLRNYSWTYKKISELSLPEDLPYRTAQVIAGSPNALQWAKMINEEGLSAADIYRLIKEEKGQDKPKKIITCPDCGKQIEG